MESKENLILWVERNRKAITEEEFVAEIGISFEEFSRLHHKEAMKAWRAYLEEKKTDKEEPTVSLAREKHLLKVISFWKQRYYALKKSLTQP